MLEKLWSRFVLQLNQTSPFFACLALFTRLVPDDQIDIAITSGREIRINPDFLLNLPDEKAFSYMLHQVMHLALQHAQRRMGRDEELWNIAADIVINEMIVNTTQWPTAPMTAWDTRFADQSVEQVYRQLREEEEAPQSGDQEPSDELQDTESSGEGDDEGDDTENSSADQSDPASDDETGDDAGNDGNTPNEKQGDNAKQTSAENQRDDAGKQNRAPRPSRSLAKLYGSHADIADSANKSSARDDMDDSAYWNDAVSQAETVALSRTQGELPGALKREFERVNRSRVDWRRELWRFVSDRQSDFSEFDQRHIHRGLYVEELRVDGMELAVAIDTSGSIDDHELGVFIKELEAVQKLHQDVGVLLYYCDAAVHGPYKLNNRQPFEPSPVGGSGTSFTPVFEAIDELSVTDKPDCLIYFTDGYGEFPPAPPAYSTLWVLTSGGCEESEVPFGTTVRVPHGN